MQQQNDATNAVLAAEIAVRYAHYWELYWAILNETAARIAEEAPLFAGIASETATRIIADAYIEGEIANLTSLVVTAEQYEAYSIAKFMAIMNSITTLTAELAADTAARISADQLLTEQGAISDAAIDYLITVFGHDQHDRIVQDVLIDEWIAALQGMGSGIDTINGRSGTLHDIDIVSTNALTTITSNTGQVHFRNNAIRTLQGVGPAAGGNIVLTVQPPLGVAADGAHGIHIFDGSGIVGPNSLELLGFIAGMPLYTFPGPISPMGSPYQAMPCYFGMYNGGTCGWSAPDTATYIVQVSVTLTIDLQNGLYPPSVHINMALGVGPRNAILAAPWDFVEGGGGLLTIVDGANAGAATLLSDFQMDMGLTATTVVEGAGSPGCFDSCGYGVWVFFNGYLQGNSVQAASVMYRVTKVP